MSVPDQEDSWSGGLDSSPGKKNVRMFSLDLVVFEFIVTSRCKINQYK